MLSQKGFGLSDCRILNQIYLYKKVKWHFIPEIKSGSVHGQKWEQESNFWMNGWI